MVEVGGLLRAMSLYAGDQVRNTVREHQISPIQHKLSCHHCFSWSIYSLSTEEKLDDMSFDRVNNNTRCRAVLLAPTRARLLFPSFLLFFFSGMRVLDIDRLSPSRVSIRIRTCTAGRIEVSPPLSDLRRSIWSRTSHRYRPVGLHHRFGETVPRSRKALDPCPAFLSLRHFTRPSPYSVQLPPLLKTTFPAASTHAFPARTSSGQPSL